MTPQAVHMSYELCAAVTGMHKLRVPGPGAPSRLSGIKHIGWNEVVVQTHQARGLPEGPPQALTPAGLLPEGGWLLKPEEYVVPDG